MPERFECTTLAKKRYINTLPFLSEHIGFVTNVSMLSKSATDCFQSLLSFCRQNLKSLAHTYWTVLITIVIVLGWVTVCGRVNHLGL